MVKETFPPGLPKRFPESRDAAPSMEAEPASGGIWAGHAPAASRVLSCSPCDGEVEIRPREAERHPTAAVFDVLPIFGILPSSGGHRFYPFLTPGLSATLSPDNPLSKPTSQRRHAHRFCSGNKISKARLYHCWRRDGRPDTRCEVRNATLFGFRRVC